MAKGAFIGVPTRINTLKILDYIESSGTQHIDTKYKATSENFRIKCKFTVLDYGANTVLFGGGGSTDIISVLLTNDNQFKFYVGSGSVSGLSYTLVYDTEYEMECYANNGTITVTLNGETKSGRYSGEINKDYPMFIFANNASGTANQKSSIRVSEFQIYDNNTLVRDYVSCRNVDDEIGLQDNANSRFYPNAGTGTFTAGAVVEEVGGNIVEVARTVKKMWVGVNGVARKVKKAWIGVNGIARLFFGGGELSYYGTATALSDNKYKLAATTIGDYALFGGGARATYRSAYVDAYDKSLTKSTAPNLRNSTYELAATSIGDYALFGGGVSSSDGSAGFAYVNAYNKSLTLSSPTSLSAGRFGLVATSIGDYALFGGGDYPYVKVVDAYNKSLTRSIPTAMRYGGFYGTATAIGDYALFADCFNNSNMTTYITAYDKSLTQSTPTDFSATMAYGAATSIGDYALFGGGGSTKNPSAIVNAYNKSLTRTIPTSLSKARYGLAATSIGDYALFGGGGIGSGNSTTPYNTVDVYDASLTRTTPTALSNAGRYLSATSVGDYALFGGGETGFNKAHNVVDVYQVS